MIRIHDHFIQWKKDTVSPLAPLRSPRLQALDDALQEYTGMSMYPSVPRELKQIMLGRVRIALYDWLAATPAWRTSVRNRTGAIERLKTLVDREVPTARKHPAYKVPMSAHTSGSRRVEYAGQSKLMNCWWACSKMVLDYHVGEEARRRIMAASEAAKRLKDADHGIKWGSGDGAKVVSDFGLFKPRVAHLTSEAFSTADIRDALMSHGPLLFTASFVRYLGARYYSAGHVIVVYGVEYDKVWFHDPGQGMALFKASQCLDWKTFRNAWHPRKAVIASPDIYAYGGAAAAG